MTSEGLAEGWHDGLPVGSPDGVADGLRDGIGDGLRDGPVDGSRDGLGDGLRDRPADGSRDGLVDRPRDAASDSGDGRRADLRETNRDSLRDTPSERTSDGTRDLLTDGIRDGRTDSSRDGRSDAYVCGSREICGNGIDDDCNGLADCKDPACFGDRSCTLPGTEVCNNNLDDDDDGLVDCEDPDCANDPTCVVNPGTEICDNGKDDNSDGLVDCTDPQCKTVPACLQAACTADLDFGAIAASGARVARTISTSDATASYGTCASPGGVARVAGFSLVAAADVRMDFSQTASSAHVVALFRAGVGQACDQNLVDCQRIGDQSSASQTYNALAAGNYWIIVQSFAGTSGSTTVTLSTSTAGVAEICDNGKDDDKDGAIDCADLDCKSASNCNQCVPDINLGALVVGGASKSTTVDTTTSSNRYHPSCAGTSTGNDAVVRFSLKQAATLTIAWQQTGDHSYALLNMPSQGQSCVSSQENCGMMGGGASATDGWSGLDPGEYLLVFKAMAAGKEGRVTISLTAYAAGGELCGNHIDDDGDLLVDCDDPDCYGVPGCIAPMCMPDGDLGDIDVGTQTTIHVDLTSATQVYKASCGKGDGRGRVYKVNLLSPMRLGFNCTQTGEQLFQVAPQLKPLDLCDENLDKWCYDASGPFGCNFAFPDLQPGPHFILVQAQSKGTEGAVDLVLEGLAQRTLEICNNGIDDDGDGAVDCNDRKCSGDPSCAPLTCVLDKQLGLLAIDGSTLLSTALTTSGAGDDQHRSACVSAPGGADVVVGFTLPGKTDLTIEWAQVGNHALVLYKADNAPLPCEANTLIMCKATADAGMGQTVLPGLAAGKYFLVADADQPGSEGGVILQISGVRSL